MHPHLVPSAPVHSGKSLELLLSLTILYDETRKAIIVIEGHGQYELLNIPPAMAGVVAAKLAKSAGLAATHQI